MQSLSSQSQSGVKIFKGSINDMEEQINGWLAASGARIVSTSMTYDHGAGFGMVLVLVTFEMGN